VYKAAPPPRALRASPNCTNQVRVLSGVAEIPKVRKWENQREKPESGKGNRKKGEYQKGEGGVWLVGFCPSGRLEGVPDGYIRLLWLAKGKKRATHRSSPAVYSRCRFGRAISSKHHRLAKKPARRWTVWFSCVEEKSLGLFFFGAPLPPAMILEGGGGEGDRRRWPTNRNIIYGWGAPAFFWSKGLSTVAPPDFHREKSRGPATVWG